VLLNAMVPAPGETAVEWWGNTGQAEVMRRNDLRERRNPDASFDAQTHFFHDLPPDVLALLLSSEDEEPAASLSIPPSHFVAGQMYAPPLSRAVTSGSSPTSSSAA
jgi:hypothetical protein